LRPGEYAIWVHDQALATVAPFLEGGRYLTLESEAIIAATLLHYASYAKDPAVTERRSRWKTIGSPASIPDPFRIGKDGATLAKVRQSLETGRDNPFLDDYHPWILNWHVARLPVLLDAFLKGQDESTARELLAAGSANTTRHSGG